MHLGNLPAEFHNLLAVVGGGILHPAGRNRPQGVLT
jgi:hypothetical protein